MAICTLIFNQFIVTPFPRAFICTRGATTTASGAGCNGTWLSSTSCDWCRPWCWWGYMSWWCWCCTSCRGTSSLRRRHELTYRCQLCARWLRRRMSIGMAMRRMSIGGRTSMRRRWNNCRGIVLMLLVLFLSSWCCRDSWIRQYRYSCNLIQWNRFKVMMITLLWRFFLEYTLESRRLASISSTSYRSRSRWFPMIYFNNLYWVAWREIQSLPYNITKNSMRWRSWSCCIISLMLLLVMWLSSILVLSCNTWCRISVSFPWMCMLITIIALFLMSGRRVPWVWLWMIFLTHASSLRRIVTWITVRILLILWLWMRWIALMLIWICWIRWVWRWYWMVHVWCCFFCLTTSFCSTFSSMRLRLGCLLLLIIP